MFKLRRLISFILVITSLFTLSACGGNKIEGYAVQVIETLEQQKYYLAFRTEDQTYYDVVAAIEVLKADGTFDALIRKWFGQEIVDFTENINAFDDWEVYPGRTFVIGVDINSFPNAYVYDGTTWGFDIECAMALCEKVGWTLQVIPIEKEDVYKQLASGNIDCAWGGIAIDDETVKSGTIATYGPYMTNDIVIVSRSNSKIWNRSKLKGRALAFHFTDENVAALDKDPALQKKLGKITRLSHGTTECFQALYEGTADAIITDTAAVYYYNCH